MDKISDYIIQKKITETKHTIVYRGKKEQDERTCIIKVFKSKFPSPSEIAQFKHEYEIIKNIDLDGIAKTYNLIEHNGQFALISEDFNGISLHEIIKEKKITNTQFLEISIKIAKTLGNLHKQNIVHKDIKPKNIVINLKNNEVKIIDFGISSIITHKNDEIYNKDIIEGTLAYLSPEQTGRTNSTVDYRTDFYSLGITFYEMLSGNVPFISNDPMEIIHSHIAKIPMSLNTMSPEIPLVISNIIDKLIAKAPEERYQNAFGLQSDLEECLGQLKNNGEIKNFNIAQNDYAMKFIIPQVVVGREKEIDTLLDSFKRISTGKKEIILVTGNPGIGKSAVINEIHKPILQRRGYFISGKYDQNKKENPYSSIIQAFQLMIKQILLENDEMIEKWSISIKESLGSNAKIISNVIPEIELIIGKTDDVPILGGEESRNRFQLVFINFVKVFATFEHPLVIFLDDLQWVDSASVDMINFLMGDPEINHLLLICAYRENEIDSSAPFMMIIDDLRNNKVEINEIKIGPISKDDVNKLISIILHCSSSDSKELAELVHRKTSGNPFFVIHFLKKLYEDGMIKLIKSGECKWNIQQINKMKITNNVVDLLVEKITKLPENTMELLKICSCIGNRFELDAISLISGRNIEEILSDFDIAIQEGYINSDDKFYHFNHDRIQEAAYLLVSDDKKKAMHWKIGNNIIKGLDEAEINEKIFFIVYHLNKGIDENITNEEKNNLIQLNMKAGEKAKNSTAYENATSYYQLASKLLGKNSWNSDYDRTYICSRELGICNYLSTNFDNANKIFNDIIKKAKNNFHKAEIYNYMAIMNSNLTKHRKAIKLFIKSAAILGFKLKEKPGPLSIMKEILKTKILIGKRKPEDLLNIPEMSNKKMMFIMEILMNASSPAYLLDINLNVYILLKMMMIVLKYGNSIYSPFVYVSYGFVIIVGLKDEKTGIEFGKLSLKAIKKFHDKNTSAKALFLYGMVYAYRIDNLAKAIEVEKESLKLTMENGDIRYAVYSEQTMLFEMIPYGVPIDVLDDIINKYWNFINKAGDTGAINYNISVRQMIKCLRGETESVFSIDDENFLEEKLIQDMIEDNVPIVIHRHYIHRAQVLYIMGNFKKAYEMILEAEKYQIGSQGTIFENEHHYYSSLVFTSLLRLDFKKYQKLLKKIKKSQKLMLHWSSFCAENFHHKYLIIEAELADIFGEGDPVDLYYQAIESAEKNGFTVNAAIAVELYARYWMRKNHKDTASLYFSKAMYGFQKWGAHIKVNSFKEKYPGLNKNLFLLNETDTMLTETIQSINTDSASGSTSIGGISSKLDFSTALKASQSISAEIHLGKLLEKIIKIVIENAGAEKGFLILENDGILTIEASGNLSTKHIDTLKSIPVNKSNMLSSAIVNYVARSKENLVLKNAATNKFYSNDAYIIKNQPKSILCSPLLNQGKLSGILYLENNLSKGAFLKERLELLNFISTQAAVSIDNARLYANLEEKVDERTMELREARDELWGEMQLAAKIQTTLLPVDLDIPGYEIYGYMDPANEVGGDYYEVIPGEINWLVIGDVSGHGVPAGLVMMMVQTAIQTIIRNNPKVKPSQLLEAVNKTIVYNIERLGEDKYMTITVLAIKEEGKIIHSGLHQDILVYRAAKNKCEKIETDGIWLGLEISSRNNKINQEFIVESGDVILLYSDGITESKNIGGEFYGINRLTKNLELCGKKSPEEISKYIIDSLDGYDNNDDITILVVKKL